MVRYTKYFGSTDFSNVISFHENGRVAQSFNIILVIILIGTQIFCSKMTENEKDITVEELEETVSD